MLMVVDGYAQGTGIGSVLIGDGDKAKGEWKRALCIYLAQETYPESLKHHSAATSVNPWQMRPHPTFFPLEKSSCPSQVWSFGFYVPQSCIKFCSIGNVLFYPVSGILLWSALRYHTRFHYYILGVSKFTELSVTFLTLTFLLSCNSRHCPRLCLVHEVDVTETR